MSIRASDATVRGFSSPNVVLIFTPICTIRRTIIIHLPSKSAKRIQETHPFCLIQEGHDVRVRLVLYNKDVLGHELHAWRERGVLVPRSLPEATDRATHVDHADEAALGVEPRVRGQLLVEWLEGLDDARHTAVSGGEQSVAVSGSSRQALPAAAAVAGRQ